MSITTCARLLRVLVKKILFPEKYSKEIGLEMFQKRNGCKISEIGHVNVFVVGLYIDIKGIISKNLNFFLPVACRENPLERENLSQA